MTSLQNTDTLREAVALLRLTLHAQVCQHAPIFCAVQPLSEKERIDDVCLPAKLGRNRQSGEAAHASEDLRESVLGTFGFARCTGTSARLEAASTHRKSKPIAPNFKV